MGEKNGMKKQGHKVQRKVKPRKKSLRLGTWNIRRGLIKREKEIERLIQDEDLDLLFLTETDVKKNKCSKLQN
jgi:hypothetical protein